MTDCPSARRLAAVHGDGLPHLWPFAHLWACTLRDSAVAPTAREAWALLTHREPKPVPVPVPVPVRRPRRAALHLHREGRMWVCECDIGGLVVRVPRGDPCAAIRSCRAIQRAGE